jgi:hypothetical protein
LTKHAAARGVSPEVFGQALRNLYFIRDFQADQLNDILNDRWQPP